MYIPCICSVTPGLLTPNQIELGRGNPLTVQVNVTLSPSIAISSDGLIDVDGSTACVCFRGW